MARNTSFNDEETSRYSRVRWRASSEAGKGKGRESVWGKKETEGYSPEGCCFDIRFLHLEYYGSLLKASVCSSSLEDRIYIYRVGSRVQQNSRTKSKFTQTRIARNTHEAGLGLSIVEREVATSTSAPFACLKALFPCTKSLQYPPSSRYPRYTYIRPHNLHTIRVQRVQYEFDNTKRGRGFAK